MVVDSDRQARELVAQEASAHWAKVQAYVAGGGFVFSAAGLVALLISLALTRVATSAAREAVAVAKADHEAQTRAWLSADCSLTAPEVLDMQIGGQGVYFNVEVKIRNHGNAPAVAVRFDAEITLDWAQGHNSPLTLLSERIRNSEEGTQIGEAVFPGDEKRMAHTVAIRMNDIEAKLNAQGDFKFISPVVYGCVSYRSAGTSGVKQTRFSYFLSSADEKGARVIQPRDPDWLRKPIYMMFPGQFQAV